MSKTDRIHIADLQGRVAQLERTADTHSIAGTNLEGRVKQLEALVLDDKAEGEHPLERAVAAWMRSPRNDWDADKALIAAYYDHTGEEGRPSWA